MPFHRVGVPYGSSFKHILSGRTFILKRNSTSECLIITLYHQKAYCQESRAGYVNAVSEFDSDLTLGPLDSNSHFSVTHIRTEDEYLNISLGTMLMFLIAREVQVNGGVYLYVQYPVLEALGFYCQFGFYPAPENVKKRHFEILEDIRKTRRASGFYDQGHLEIPLQDKIRMNRGFSLWRGAVNPVLELLEKNWKVFISLGSLLSSSALSENAGVAFRFPLPETLPAGATAR